MLSPLSRKASPGSVSSVLPRAALIEDGVKESLIAKGVTFLPARR